MTSAKANKLWHTDYIGDEDSKSYNDIYQAYPYQGVAVNRLECIGHIQKRVGTTIIDKVFEANSSFYLK